ncbi:FtsQ-type POTRA domain-containing protein [Idiomarina seosinensis]|uniref:cell division protein FtsQ/DivIB n=1 Tax=Idiomarina seosinensis TaxID=281739 RepID=UPI00384F32A6
MSRQPSQPSLRRWNFWLGLGVCLLTLGAFITGIVQLTQVLKDEQQVPLARLNVEGELRQLTPAEIRRALTAKPLGSFFTADVNQLRQRVEQLPWVAKASVRKVWPNRLAVHVTERKPLAYWNSDRLVTAQGEVFRAEVNSQQLSQALPHLSGPETAVDATLQQFNQLQQMLQVNGMQLNALSLSERFAVSAVLDSGIELKLGREAALQRIKRFIDLLPTIEQHENSQQQTIQQVDLRYDTGAAVKWQTPQDKES